MHHMTANIAYCSCGKLWIDHCEEMSTQVEKLAKAARLVVEIHDKAAAELEPGFTCGCKTVCQPLLEALEASGQKTGRIVRT